MTSVKELAVVGAGILVLSAMLICWWTGCDEREKQCLTRAYGVCVDGHETNCAIEARMACGLTVGR